MSERDRRMEEREERRARRIQERRVAEGRERRELRFFRRRERPRPKKKAEKQKSYVETVATQTFDTYLDEDLDPDEKTEDRPDRRLKSEGNIYAGAVDPIDRLVTRFSETLWGRSEKIRPSTMPLSYEEQRYRRVKRDIPDLSLIGKRAQFGALNIGIGAVEGFTFPVRPSAWVRTAEGLVGLATDKERRREAAEFAKARPAALGLQLLGGVGGGYAAGKIIDKIHGGYIRRKYLTDLPDEAFYAEDGIPDPHIPRQIDVERLVPIDKTQVRVADDLGAGFLDSHQVKVGTLPPKGKSLKTLDLRMGKAATSRWEEFAKGYYRTGADLVPGLIPKGKGRLETWYRFGLESGRAYLPPIGFDVATKFTPRSLTSLGLIGLSGIHSRPIETIKSDTVEKQVNKQLDRVGLGKRQRRRERVMFEGRTAQRREILPDLKPFTRIRPMPTLPGFAELPVQIHRQRQRQRAIAIPELRLEPTQRQEQRQTQTLAQIERMSMREPNLELVYSRRRKKKGRRGDMDLFTFGEIRAYPLKGVEKIMKEMGL